MEEKACSAANKYLKVRKLDVNSAAENYNLRKAYTVRDPKNTPPKGLEVAKDIYGKPNVSRCVGPPKTKKEIKLKKVMEHSYIK